MDISKGLFSDTRPQDQPEGFYAFGKNGIASHIKKAIENEPGFLPSSAVIPYKPIGIVETDKYPVIISTNNVNTAIGYFNQDLDTYQPIYNDASLPFKFKFTTDHYVTGQAQRNYKGEIVIAITDKNVDPLYINCDHPIATTLESLFLFPRAVAPLISVTQEQGGALPPGADYVLAKYVKADGTETSYLAISDVVDIAGTPGTLTDKALIITLTNLDTTYDEVQLAIISKVNGVTSVVQLTSVPISSSTMTQVYSGAETTETLTLEEVLINPATYNKVGTFGQLGDSLYAADLSKEPRVSMQKYANMIKVNWISSLISVIPPTQEHITGAKKSFMHQEVYCLYIQYSLTAGGWSDYFIIPGTEPLSADLATSSEPGQELLNIGGVPKYKVEDTIHSYSTAGKVGEMGIWVNADETYPNTDEFNSTPYGGRDLRGKNVLHHRFPSIQWCKDALYPFDTEYGKTKLDLLGIRVTNVIIPAAYTNTITGWRLVYAKRTLANSTVVGQGLLMHAARASGSLVDTDYISTGGNWGAKMDFQGTSNDKQLDIDKKTFRFHSFDMLFAQPAVTPSYLAPQLKLNRPNLAYDGGLIEDFSISPDTKNGPIVYLIDYTEKGTTPVSVPSGKRIRKVDNTSYVPVNTIAGKWKNLQQETIFGGNITDTRELLTDAELSFSNLWVGPAYEQPDKAAQFEFTYLMNLMALRNDICKPYTSQSVASAGQRAVGGTGDFFGGDVFLNDYSFHTYGWNDSENRGYGAELGGIKVARRFICEAVANINLRYEIPGNIYSKWYPHSPLVPQDPNNYILSFNRKIDPNQFGYNRDLSSVNEFIFGTVFDPLKEDITQFPFRIHRGGKLSRSDKRKSWRTFLPLDYYEAEKDMGFIVNIDGFEDRLIIHHENAMFLTQGKSVLDNGLLGITIGTGDIFATEPTQTLPTKLGYAGTQHDLACIKTVVGYIFLDSKQGQVFIYNGKLRLANNGLNNFFRQFLRMKEKNPYMGNGYTIGYDPDYRRFILTAKNKKIAEPVNYEYAETQAFYNTLHIGDVVYKNGRYQRFLGPNTTTYNCYTPPLPVPDDKVFTIAEDAPLYTTVGALTGTNVLNYIISNSDGTFYLIDNLLILNKALDYETIPVYHLTMVAEGINNVVVPFNVTVNVTNVVNEVPLIYQQRVYIDETIANGAHVMNVAATDPNGHALTYSIIGGNTAGALAINATTGEITVASNTTIKYNLNPLLSPLVKVTNGTTSAQAYMWIGVNPVQQAPDVPIITAYPVAQDATPGVVGNIAMTDPNTTENLRLETTYASVPEAFTVDPDTHDIILNAGVTLDPTTVPTYTIGLRAIDNTDLTTDFSISLNIYYDPHTLIYQPITPSCSGAIKHWASVKVKTSTIDIAVYNNIVEAQYFQGLKIPYYPGVPNSIDCGGTNNTYFSEVRNGFATKNDCTTGYGEVVEFVLPAGFFVSTVSVADANAQADAYIASNKQGWANSMGQCLR